MLQKLFFKEMFLLIIFIAILHMIGTSFDWYVGLGWFDVPMHFLGGLWVGLACLWIFEVMDRSTLVIKTRSRVVFFSILCAFTIGLIWEIFEGVTGIELVSAAGYWSDTSLDLVMDLIGGALAGLYAWRILRGKLDQNSFLFEASATLSVYEK